MTFVSQPWMPSAGSVLPARRSAGIQAGLKDTNGDSEGSPRFCPASCRSPWRIDPPAGGAYLRRRQIIGKARCVLLKSLDVNQPKMNQPYMQPNYPMVKRQNPQTVKGSGISLDHNVRLEMAYELDKHNCALHVALHQYNKHHWLSEGAEGFISPAPSPGGAQSQRPSSTLTKSASALPAGRHPHRPPGGATRDVLHQVRGRRALHHAGLFAQRPGARDETAAGTAQADQACPWLNDFGTVEVLESAAGPPRPGLPPIRVLEDDTLVRGIEHVFSQPPDKNRRPPKPRLCSKKGSLWGSLLSFLPAPGAGFSDLVLNFILII